jgi:FkbM family methyltransferase
MKKKILKFIYFYLTSTRIYKNIIIIFIKIIKAFGFNISLSQFGEDLIIQSLIRRNSGVYVDVGCNRPILKNNTFQLYMEGYTGINIDGNEAYQSAWSNLRPNDTFLSEIVSNNVNLVDFHISNAGYVSTISKEYIQEKAFNYDRVEQRRPRTLSDILVSNRIGEIDLLCVDVEGSDYNVLLSIDFDLYKPNLICVEDHLFDVRNPTNSNVYNLLTGKNYMLVANIKPNLFFQK